jgi:hypothetical protein
LRTTGRESAADLTLKGRMSDLAEGGCGGEIDGTMMPGELVELIFGVPNCDLTLELNARVRYRNAESHGFEFVDLTASQHKGLRRCLEVLATSN